jgi:hypothetical protein
MAMTDEELLLQMNILTSKTSDNPNMTYKTNAILNKGLNPEYFSGQYTKIVNALNQLANNTEIAISTSNNVANKVNELLLDTSNEDNQAIWENVQSLMGQPTIIEGIQDLLEGKLEAKVLGITAEDINKILVVDVDANNNPIIKAVEQISSGENISSLDELEYSNRYVSSITNAKEALDYVINEIVNGDFEGGLGGGVQIGEITWDMIDDRPEHVADNLSLTNTHLQLKDGDSVISTVPITSDNDIDEVMAELDNEE